MITNSKKVRDILKSKYYIIGFNDNNISFCYPIGHWESKKACFKDPELCEYILAWYKEVGKISLKMSIIKDFNNKDWVVHDKSTFLDKRYGAIKEFKDYIEKYEY